MAKVSLQKCDDYNLDVIKKVLIKSIDDLGGLEEYISPGEKVLLKVNLLMKKRPEEAVTTHPIFVKALAEILSEFGADVLVGDSPGGPFNEKALRGIYKSCGYDIVSDKDKNIKLNYNINQITVHRDDLYLLKRIEVIEILEKVDKVISVSKLKTHGMTVFTGAVKNMFGTVPGISKAEYHFKMPKIKDFTNMLVDVCKNADPVLSFMDGIVGMEGAGPSAGNPIKIGAILVSNSPYHLDVVATKLVGINPMEVPTIERTIERNMVKKDYVDIEMTGLELNDFPKISIKKPKGGGISFLDGKLPSFISKPIINLLSAKPIFDYDICVKCGECERACPANAIVIDQEGPKVDYDKCIRCFCCQELCPYKAVKIYRNPIIHKIIKM
ncbi:MAG: DUF362 domain-containing protein [Clostridiales bacterium]|nr:DUF362 domain-containing protein [Clostridiales bacterium]